MTDLQKLTVRKIDAAARQLDSAIWLWFEGADPVSIHTLAAAAHQIVHDIKVSRGDQKGLLYDSDLVVEEYKAYWVKKLKEAPNFFKHADRDPEPEGAIEFSPSSNPTYIAMTILGLQMLKFDLSDACDAFMLWITINEPRFVKQDYLELFVSHANVADVDQVRRMAKSEFFATVTKAMQKRRS